MKSAVGSSAVMIRAREVQSSLGTKHPSCVKEMVKAHVDAGYWMVMLLFLNIRKRKKNQKYKLLRPFLDAGLSTVVWQDVFTESRQ